jgi:divalent metal cation (Fe/Co/Zn/Cd) transporter
LHVTNWLGLRDSLIIVILRAVSLVGGLGLTDSLIIVILHAVSLVGESAPPEMLQKLTYLAIRHHPQIKRVDTVRAYTFGVLYFVEVSVSLFYSLHPGLSGKNFFLQAYNKNAVTSTTSN